VPHYYKSTRGRFYFGHLLYRITNQLQKNHVEKQGMNDQSHSFLSSTMQHEDCDVDLDYLSDESDASPFESDPDDDVAIVNAEAELATMITPVHQDSGVTDLKIGCLFGKRSVLGHITFSTWLKLLVSTFPKLDWYFHVPVESEYPFRPRPIPF
jgi:hypothetical protein